MRLVVDHLTRMKGRRVCVGLLDTGSGTRYRPLLRHPDEWTRSDTELSVGALFEARESGSARRGAPPMVEDLLIQRGDLRFIEVMDDSGLWAVIRRHAAPSLAEAFGPALQASGTTRWVAPGTGTASLAAVAVDGASIVVRQEKLRLEVEDAHGAADLPITDLRLWREPPPGDGVGQAPPQVDGRRARTIARLVAMAAPGSVVLTMGMSREFRGKHWLQVNNVHLAAGALDHPVLAGGL